VLTASSSLPSYARSFACYYHYYHTRHGGASAANLDCRENRSGNGQNNVSGPISDSIARLAPAASVIYTVTAAVDPAATGTLSNTVTVSAANDTNPGNDSATATLTPEADLSIVKASGGNTAVPGSDVTYAITVASSGPST
jgi:hypothetical protein